MKGDRLTLKEFVEQFTCPNTMIRLWYKKNSFSYPYSLIKDDVDDVIMNHALLKGVGIELEYLNSKVIGVNGVLVDGHYPEAVNIVIDIDGEE